MPGRKRIVVDQRRTPRTTFMQGRAACLLRSAPAGCVALVLRLSSDTHSCGLHQLLIKGRGVRRTGRLL